MGRLAVILGSNALGPGGEEIAAAAAEHASCGFRLPKATLLIGVNSRPSAAPRMISA